jgi:hypothetical protein
MYPRSLLTQSHPQLRCHVHANPRGSRGHLTTTTHFPTLPRLHQVTLVQNLASVVNVANVLISIYVKHSLGINREGEK